MIRKTLCLLSCLSALILAGSPALSQDEPSGEISAPGRVSVAPFPEPGAASPDLQRWTGTGWNVVHLEVISGQLDDNSPLSPEMVNSADGAGLTPLHYAASMGNPAPVRILLDNGADINASALGGFSVLHAACQFGDVEMVRMLLENKADSRRLFRGDWQWLSDGVLQDDPEQLRSGMQAMLGTEEWDAGISCMHLAADAGNSQLVALLLERGLDPALPTLINHVSPLHLCNTSPDCTSLLLAAGADPDPSDDFARQTPLFGSSFENTQLLLAAGADPDVLNSWGYGNLHTVESATMAQLLIDNDASLELRGAFGETPLISAADRGLEPVIRVLLAAGADVNAADYLARTALDRAQASGRMDIAALLEEAGGMDGFTMHPFHYTAAQGEDQILRMALEAEEDANGTDDCGWTALHYAAMSGHSSTVQLLLDAGADVTALDSEGCTALSRCQLYADGILGSLLAAGADPDAVDFWFGSTLLRAASNGNESAAIQLLEAGADVSSRGPDGLTALMYAAQGGSFVLMERLIEAGADLEARDDMGMTALMHAIGYSSFYGEANTRRLLEAGADVTAFDSLGRGMLHHLAPQGSIQLASRLVEAGSPGTTLDARGYSPPRLARLAGNEILATWLETLE